MKTRTAFVGLALAAILTGFVPLPVTAQPVPAGPADLKTKVATILERFPAETAAARDALCAEIISIGPAALAETLALVQPPGGTNDAKARFAVNGLAVHVTRPGAERERVLLVRALLAAISVSQDPDRAAFFVSQIERVGRTEAVKPLSKYLSAKGLAGPAVRALQTIGGTEAARALLAALDAGKAPAEATVAIIDALGAMRSRESVKKLIPLAASSEEGLRRAARSALANIGDPAAGPVLSRVHVASSWSERAEAPRLFLLFARRLSESGRASEALEAAREVLAAYARPEDSQIGAEALTLIVSLLGCEKAFPDLAKAVDGPSPALRAAALELAANGPLSGPADQRPLPKGLSRVVRRPITPWIEKAKAASPEIRAAIIEAFRANAFEFPDFYRGCLQDPAKIVRLAAIRSVSPDSGNLELLLPLLSTADEEEAAALRAVLLRYRADGIVPEAARRIAATPHPGKAVLIDILGEKGARGEIERVFRLAADPEPATRAAALGALAKLSGEFEIPSLVALLEKAADADDIVRLQDAVAAAATRDADPARKGAVLVDLLKTAAPERQAAILRVLPKVGGERARLAVVEKTAASDLKVQTAAVYALSQWPDSSAAADLLRIVATTASKRYRLLALDGYVRLVGRANMPAQQRLALYGDLLAQAFDDADKKAVVNGVAAVREPESLRLLGGLLDNPALREAAAAALLELASEQAPHERWLSGHEAYSVLRRVEALQPDPGEKARVAALIVDRLRQGGYVPLFDGRSLAGWKGLVADPPARAKMAPGDLAKAQSEADERMRAHWRAVDGVLVFDGQGESLCTAHDYGDFELLVDWKIEQGGDSGLYLRGSPQVQIWDASANPVGSGGLYNNRKGQSVPSERADRPVGEWNSFRVIMIGERVAVYLNDKLVVDNVVLENYWERDKPIYPAGPIELQAHGNPLFFRNIFIREIPRDPGAPPPLAAAEADEGFVPLFNGRDLSGWTGGGGGYAAEDGKIVVHPERGGGNLYTEKEYADFVLRFEFKLTPAANNGLGIRAPLEGDAAYAGMEIQILEDGSPVYWGLKPYQYHGSIYGVVPARRGLLRPVGEWNTEEVTAKGRRVTVAVNGVVVVDADIDAASAGGAIDGREHPGLKRASGHIGFLGHGSVLEFRGIRIKELKESFGPQTGSPAGGGEGTGRGQPRKRGLSGRAGRAPCAGRR